MAYSLFASMAKDNLGQARMEEQSFIRSGGQGPEGSRERSDQGTGQGGSPGVSDQPDDSGSELSAGSIHRSSSQYDGDDDSLLFSCDESDVGVAAAEKVGRSVSCEVVCSSGVVNCS